MRIPVFLVGLAVSSSALAAPQCALPEQGAVPVTDRQIQSNESGANPTPLPEATSAELATLPFVAYIVRSGAALTDLGVTHGLRGIIAKSGNEYMVFQVTPDGTAAVSGAQTDLTSAQLSAIAGEAFTPLGTQHGLVSFFVRSGSAFQVFYATPDNERVIPGVMWDATGKDLTRDLVAKVPGALPTVEVGNVATKNVDLATTEASAKPPALPLLEKTFFGLVGDRSAPRLWIVIDPQCVYSVRAYQLLKPYVDAGRLQLSVIPIAVLDFEDNGQSTKSALALLSNPAEMLVSAWQTGDVSAPPLPQAADRLRTNAKFASAIGLEGTPTFLWKQLDGSEGRLDGMPTNVDALVAAVGR